MQKFEPEKSNLELPALEVGFMRMSGGYRHAGGKRRVLFPIHADVERATTDTAERRPGQMWKGWLAVVFLLTFLASQASAQQLPPYIQRPPDAAGVFAIYPGSGVPRGSEKWTWHEQTVQVPGSKVPNRMVRNVVIPTVTMYKPDAGTANRTALIVAPGGAFTFLSLDSEGVDVAHWATQHGITAFLLKYRVAHTPENNADFFAFLPKLFAVLPHPGPTVTTPPTGTQAIEEARNWADKDGLQAIRFVRQHATEWGVDPKRIGIVGFSAGGGIAVDAAMHHTADSRPDFVAGIYPGYRPGVGISVPPDAPPLFIAAADDDVLVAPISGAKLYEAWHEAGKPAALHIFLKGGHGFGMKKQDLPSDSWTNLFKNWLAALGYLSPARR